MDVKFAKRMERIDASGIRKMFDLAQKARDVIDFSLGQAHFDIPGEVKRFAIDAIKSGSNRYTPTQGLDELRAKILEYLEKKYGFKDKSFDVIVTGGATAAIFLAMLSLVDIDDGILIPDPYFPLYFQLVKFCRGRPILIDTYPTKFRLHSDLIKRAAKDGAKILIFNNPVNPTGITYTIEEIEDVADICRRYRILIISDEVYNHFVYDFDHETMLNHYERTIMVGALSKTYSMAGWRIGYACGPKELIDKMTTLQQFSYVCAPSIAQKTAIHALDIDMSRYIYTEYKRRRDIVYNELKDNFDIVEPQGAFYVFPAAPNKDADDFVKKALDKGVVIVPGKACSSKDTNFRLSYAVPDDKLRRGIEILKSLA